MEKKIVLNRVKLFYVVINRIVDNGIYEEDEYDRTVYFKTEKEAKEFYEKYKDVVNYVVDEPQEDEECLIDEEGGIYRFNTYIHSDHFQDDFEEDGMTV